jgi:hypothetical protein
LLLARQTRGVSNLIAERETFPLIEFPVDIVASFGNAALAIQLLDLLRTFRMQVRTGICWSVWTIWQQNLEVFTEKGSFFSKKKLMGVQ